MSRASAAFTFPDQDGCKEIINLVALSLLIYLCQAIQLANSKLKDSVGYGEAGMDAEDGTPLRQSQ